LIVTQL